MIPLWKHQAIETLLAQATFSQREIARQLKVWRGTVADIANGRRQPRRPQAAADRDGEDSPSGPSLRCPDCGAKVRNTCRGCRVRRWLLRQPRRPPSPYPADRPENLELRLREPHRARYEEVRARRLARDRRQS